MRDIKIPYKLSIYKGSSFLILASSKKYSNYFLGLTTKDGKFRKPVLANKNKLGSFFKTGYWLMDFNEFPFHRVLYKVYNSKEFKNKFILVDEKKLITDPVSFA